MLAAALALVFSAPRALAAGGAFAVDDSEVGAPGECKVEAWASFARNHDFIGVLAPACVVDLGRPVELGAQVERARAAGSWSTGLALKAKTSLIPLDGRTFGVGLVGGIAFDLTTRETAEYFVSLPVTLQLAEPLRINLNVGGLRDEIDNRNFVTWGAGFELSLSRGVTLIAEAFGQNSTRPAAQVGLRFTPHEKFDFDVIYGRNLAGERADWITTGVNLRF
jgi:hypothetical protein